MIRRVVLTVVLVAGCARLSDDVLYRCEDDGGCFQADHVCDSRGLCVASSTTGGGGGNASGGGSGGGSASVGGGSSLGGGSSTGGGVSAGGGSTGGGRSDAGVDGGTGGDGGTCIPKTCPGSPSSDCGLLNDGCGNIVNCAALGDGGSRTCPTSQFCGAGINSNLCSAPVSCRDGWCWENPLPQGNTLYAVWASTENDIWAVGELGTLLHYNGSYWKLFVSPTRKTLHAIDGRVGDVWAAGDNGIILHFDGGSWAVDPATPNGTNAYRAVAMAAATGDVFIGDNAGDLYGRVDGGWQPIEPFVAHIGAMHAFAVDDLYVAGTPATPGSAGIGHWDGMVWTAIQDVTEASFTSMAATANDQLVLGATNCALYQVTNQVLSQVAFAACDGGITATAATTAGDVFVAGNGFIAHYDGMTVKTIALSDGGQWLGASMLDAGRVAVVGLNGLVAKSDTASTQIMSSGPIDDFTSVFANPNGFDVAGNSTGFVYSRNVVNRRATWSKVPGQAGTHALVGIWASDIATIDAVTEANECAQAIANNFILQQFADPLYAITHHVSGLQFAGENIEIFFLADGHKHANAIAVVIGGSPQTLRGMFSDGTTLFAVTDEGQILETVDGTGWSSAGVLGAGLRSVHGTPATAAGRLLAVAGLDGGVWTGTAPTNLTPWNVASHVNFNGICATSPTTAVVVGDKATAYVLANGTWTSGIPPATADLLAVAALADGGVVAAGRRGTLLFHAP